MVPTRSGFRSAAVFKATAEPPATSRGRQPNAAACFHAPNDPGKTRPTLPRPRGEKRVIFSPAERQIERSGLQRAGDLTEFGRQTRKQPGFIKNHLNVAGPGEVAGVTRETI
jgi:hypothetical protein